MALKQRKVFVYRYHGKCLFAAFVTPLMRLLALICEVKFEKSPGSSWFKITFPKIEIDQSACQR